MKLTKSKLKQMIKEELEGEWVLKNTGEGGYVQKATSEKPSNIANPNFEGDRPKIFKSKVEAEGWKKAAENASGLTLDVEPKESLSEGHGDPLETDKELEKTYIGNEPGALELRIRKLEGMIHSLLKKLAGGPMTPEQAEEIRRSATPFNEGVHKMKLTEENLKELIKEELESLLKEKSPPCDPESEKEVDGKCIPASPTDLGRELGQTPGGETSKLGM